jgi:hypothetical protein
MSGRKEILETQVRKGAQRALKRALNEIENEPKLTIEACPDKAIIDSKQMEDVLSWLFGRREVNNGD